MTATLVSFKTPIVIGKKYSLVLVNKHVVSRYRFIFEIIARMQSELNNRFSRSKPILLSCDSLNPTTELFLKYEVMTPLSEAIPISE